MRNIGLWCLLCLVAIAQPAGAQSRPFVSGAVIADLQRLSRDSLSRVDDSTLGGGAGVGVLVNERWDVRAEAGVAGTSTRMRPLLTGVSAFQERVQTRITTASLLVGYRPFAGGRVQLTVLGGIAFLHVKTQLDSIPSGLVVVPQTQIDNVAGPTIGAEVPITLFSHIAVVPELRVHAFTLRQDSGGGFAIRPGIGLRWRN